MKLKNLVSPSSPVKPSCSPQLVESQAGFDNDWSTVAPRYSRAAAEARCGGRIFARRIPRGLQG